MLDPRIKNALVGYKNNISTHIQKMCDLTSDHFLAVEQNSLLSEDLIIQSELSQQAMHLYQIFGDIVSLSSPGQSNSIVHQMAFPVKETLLVAATRGREDSALLDTLRESNNISLIQSTSRHMKYHIREQLLSLQALGFQSVCIINSIHEDDGFIISHPSTLQLIAIASRLGTMVESLLNEVTTYEYIRNHFTEDRLSVRFSSNLRQSTVRILSF